MNIKKYIRGTMAIIAMGLLSSCSSVEIPDAPAVSQQKATNLVAQYTNDSRDVKLTWQNNAAATGVAIYCNNELMYSGDLVTEYSTRAAPNKDLLYTIKQIYNNGAQMSEGVTATVRINHPVGNKVALVVPDDYTTSQSETNGVNWFQTTYVDNNLGTIIKCSDIANLKIDDYDRAWVLCERTNGMENGWRNLPGNMAADKTIETMKDFAAWGGSFFLTNHATQLVAAVNRIEDTYAPHLYNAGGAIGGNNETLGVHPIIGNVTGQIYDHKSHAIYNGMTYHSDLFAGIYAFVAGNADRLDNNCMWDLNAYGLTANPNVVKTWEDLTNSTVLGTWNHVVDYCCAGIVDFNPTATYAGRVLCVGLATYTWYQNPNGVIDQIELFTKNCINYLKFTE